MKFKKQLNKIIFKMQFIIFLSRNSKKAFTLSELIVSSTISITILISAYYFINIISQLNKNDSSQIKLFSKLDAALDFVLDEINSGKEIIVDKNKINNACSTADGEFIFALKLPTQINSTNLNTFNSDYLNENDFINLDCPIIYSLDMYKNKIKQES